MTTQRAAKLLFSAFLFCGTACSEGAPPLPFQVRESVEQLLITHAPPGSMLTVRDAAGRTIQTGTADPLGSLIFRKLPPGDGYTVSMSDSEKDATSGPLHVLSVEASRPDPSFYASQRLNAGSGYIKTRDGTQLAI